MPLVQFLGPLVQLSRTRHGPGAVQFLGPLVQLFRTRHGPGAIVRTSGAIIPHLPVPWCNSYDLWCNFS